MRHLCPTVELWNRPSGYKQRNRFAEDLFWVPPVAEPAEPATRRPSQKTLENREMWTKTYQDKLVERIQSGTKNIKKQVNSEKIKQRQIRCLVSFLVKFPGRFFAYKVPKARWVVDFRQVGFGHVTEEHFDNIFWCTLPVSPIQSGSSKRRSVWD